MLSTDELKKYIVLKIEEKIIGVTWSGISFCEGGANSPENTYVFAKDSKYHFLYCERGHINTHYITESEEEIFVKVLEQIVFEIALKYELKHRINGMDCRRIIFEKEIELFSLYGEKIKKEQEREIENILKVYPYRDENY